MENVQYKLYGAILGDLAGRPYEYNYSGDFSEFVLHDEKSSISDDTILTLATAAYRLGKFNSFEEAYLKMAMRYNDQSYGYGKGFRKWFEDKKAMEESFDNSYGNGCLMRMSPLMYAYDYYERENKVVESCLCSHVHPESITSALRLKAMYDRSNSRRIQLSNFNIIKPFTSFDVTAKGTEDFVKRAFVFSNSTHKTIEAVVKCGGDTDTNASIIGELMNFTFNDLTEEDVKFVESKLDPYLLGILHEFNEKF